MINENKNELTIGKIYSCLVIRIQPTYVVLKTDADVFGICHISEVSDYRVQHINDFFKENQTYDFELIDIDREEKKYRFSYKKLNPKFLKKHYQIIPSTQGFKNIKENTERLLK